MSAIPNPPQPSAPIRTSKAAITSLIFGILLCLPVIGPLIAIICGFVGLSKTKQGRMKGRGLAITGLILGFIGLPVTVGEFAVGGAALWVGAKVADAMHNTDNFVKEINSGDYAAALTRCTSSVTQEDLVKVHDQLADMGTFQGAKVSGSTKVTSPAGNVMETHGTLNFEKGTKNFTLRMLVGPGASFKIDGIDVTD